MLSPTEKTLLLELLEIAPLPEGTLTYNELMGFMFGLAITPIHIAQDEWLDAVFGEDSCNRCDCKSYRPLSASLTQIYSAFLAKQEQGQLHFPYPIETLRETEIDEVREWVSGLEEALSLRPDIWDPAAEGNVAGLNDSELEELFFCMMVIQGLADPVEVQFFLERIPDELFDELFAAYDLQNEEKDRNFQALLLCALPLTIQALQRYSQKMQETIPLHAQPTSSSVLRYDNLERKSQGVTLFAEQKAGSKKSNIIQVDFSTRSVTGKNVTNFGSNHKTAPYYQLKISIKDAKPPIWRRVLVPGSMSLAKLHLVIQVSMGWLNAHLHQFSINDIDYGPGDSSSYLGEQLDENFYSLHSVAKDVHKSFDYIYDFGDYWHHQILIEKRISPKETGDGNRTPRVIKGRRSCPPENIGGIWGYQEFLEAYTNPSHDDHPTMVEWAGPDFRPELFGTEEMKEVNKVLSSIFTR